MELYHSIYEQLHPSLPWLNGELLDLSHMHTYTVDSRLGEDAHSISKITVCIVNTDWIAGVVGMPPTVMCTVQTHGMHKGGSQYDAMSAM